VGEFAERARQYVLNPQRNPLRETLGVRPVLGLFNDIPRHKFRFEEAQAWARAGFDFVICDGEHSLHEGFYGRDEYASLLRLGLTPIQRLPRDAGPSYYGDALCLGARGVMRPYGTTIKDLDDLLEACQYPNGVERPSKRQRGAYPLKLGDGTLEASRDVLRALETAQCLVSLQFETTEYVFDAELRKLLLRRLESRGGIAFLGALDLSTRATAEELPLLDDAVAAFFRDAKDIGCVAGGIFGHKEDHRKSVDAIKAALFAGARFVACPYLASELPFYGAATAARDFHVAIEEYRASELSSS